MIEQFTVTMPVPDDEVNNVRVVGYLKQKIIETWKIIASEYRLDVLLEPRVYIAEQYKHEGEYLFPDDPHFSMYATGKIETED